VKFRAAEILGFVPIAVCAALAGCHRERSARSDRDLAIPLTTGFEDQRSAPLGPGGELVAYSAAAWDSGWKALALPGAPPVVDFNQNAATLRAQYFGGSPFGYESRVDSAVSEAGGAVIAVYAHERISDGGVDTSSRKVLATAFRLPANRPARVTVQWRVIGR
jgi:hypothetical protein